MGSYSDMRAAMHDTAEGRARLIVDALADGWRAPADADALADHLEPWIHPDCRFTQPLLPSVGTGPDAFRETFARPLFDVLSDVRGTVESWAYRGDELFVALRLTATLGRHPVSLRVCDQLTLVDGRVAARRSYADLLPLLPALVRTPRSLPRLLRRRLDAARAARRPE